MARAVWLALVVPSLGLFIASLLAYYQQLQRACVGPLLCSLPGALTAKVLQALSTSGFSVSGYAALLTISLAIITAIWCAVGFLIFWRKSDDWLALLAAFFLVMFSITPSSSNPGFVLLFAYPVLALPVSLVSFLGRVSIGVFLLLFPNGRLVPRWMGLILLLVIIHAFLSDFPSPTSTFETNWPAWLYLIVIGVLIFAILFSQIYRYRRVSTTSPAPTDEVGCLRSNGGVRSCHRDRGHWLTHPIQRPAAKSFRWSDYYFHLLRRHTPDPALNWFLDFAVSTVRHRRADQSYPGIWRSDGHTRLSLLWSCDRSPGALSLDHGSSLTISSSDSCLDTRNCGPVPAIATAHPGHHRSSLLPSQV